MKTKLVTTLVLALAVVGGHASTFYWSGPASIPNPPTGYYSWNNPAYWGGSLPGPGDDVVFPDLGDYRTVDLAAGSWEVNSVKFDSPHGCSLNSGTLKINSFVEQAGSGFGQFGCIVDHDVFITYQGSGSGLVTFLGLSGSPDVTVNAGSFWWMPTLSLASQFTPTTLTVSGPTAYLRIGASNSITFSGSMTIDDNGVVCKEYVGSTLSAASCSLATGGQLKLAGPATMVSVNIASSASLVSGCSISTAVIQANVIYAAGAISEFELGTPNIVGSGVNDLISVTGDLTLQGVMNLVPQSGFGVGAYRLFNYTGTLTDNGVGLNNIPHGYKASLDTTTSGQVNLIVSPAPTLQVSQAGNDIVLSWSDSSYHLQATPSLQSGPGWTNVPGASSVTLPRVGNTLFFRLISP